MQSKRIREIKTGTTIVVLEEAHMDGHHRGKIGTDEWMSLRTAAGSLLATPVGAVATLPQPSAASQLASVELAPSHLENPPSSSLHPQPEPQPQLAEGSELHAFLSQIRLLEYYEPLIALGAADLRDLTNLEEVDLADMGMKPLEARRLHRELEQRTGTSV